MSEIQLSDSLPIIETEIRQYQNLAGESIFEIGRRLKHVKENDLVHGEFIKWVEGQLNMDRTTANKFMKVADELPNVDTYRHLGSNALYMITTLPESERTKEHVTSKGETKTPDEMTVKELRELKKQLKQRDELIASREQENEILQSKLEDAENKEPEIIERYSEPDDYEDLKYLVKRQEEILSGREEHVSKLEKEIADMRAKRSDMDRKSKEYDQLNQAINEMNGRLDKGQKRIAAQKEVYDLVRNANRLIEEIAPLSYLVNTEEILDNEYAVKPIKKLIKNLNDITKRLNESINQTEILEVN